jgi:hypothetical protein
MVEKEKAVPFTEVLSALKDGSQPFHPKFLQRFSDINTRDLSTFKKTWGSVSTIRKVNLLQDLEDLSDSETLVCFDDVAKIGLTDPDADVRALAARLLWESEDVTLIPVFQKMMEKDPEPIARAAGAAALGRFVLIGEIDEIPSEIHQQVEDSLLLVCTGKDVPKVIDSNENTWLASALFAISRSLDDRWEKQILTLMKHPDDEVRFEAIRAAGELEIESARQPLIDILESGEEEGDNHLAVIWSLSQIGGDDAKEALNGSLEKCEDDEEAEYIEDALNNLKFNQDLQLAELMELPIEDLDNNDEESS